jgi:hypothetical protein
LFRFFLAIFQNILKEKTLSPGLLLRYGQIHTKNPQKLPLREKNGLKGSQFLADLTNFAWRILADFDIRSGGFNFFYLATLSDSVFTSGGTESPKEEASRLNLMFILKKSRTRSCESESIGESLEMTH